MLDPEQGYNHAIFKKPYFNSDCEKANSEVCVKSENMSIISFEYVRKSIKVVYSDLPDVLYNPTDYQRNRKEHNFFQLKLLDIDVTLKSGQGH